MRNKLIIFFVINLTFLGCVTPDAKKGSTLDKTSDFHLPSTGIYYNNSIPFKVAFPKDKWEIYTDFTKKPPRLLNEWQTFYDEIKDFTTPEIAMIAVHNSEVIVGYFATEYGISDISPLEYLKIIREFNMVDFLIVKETSIKQRKIGGQDCVDFEGTMRVDGINATIRELIFLKNNYACQLLFIIPSVLYEVWKGEIDNLFYSISFTESYYSSGDKSKISLPEDMAIEPEKLKIAKELYSNAQSSIDKGQYAQAIRDLNKAIEINSKYGEAYILRGSIYAEVKEYEKAWSDLYYAETLGSQIPYDLIKKLQGGSQTMDVEISKDTSLYKAIERHFHERREKASRDEIYTPKLLNEDSNFEYFPLLKGGEIELKPNRIESDSADYYYIQALSHYYSKRYSEAISNFDTAIELEPNHSNAYRGRGDTYFYKGQYEEAIGDYNKAIESDPEYISAYQNRGNLYYKQKQYEEAFNDFSRAIELDPKYAPAYDGRARIYYKKQQYEEALSDFNKVLEIKPEDLNTYYRRGLTYQRMDQNNKAIDDFNKILEISPRNGKAYNSLGNVYKKIGQIEEACFNWKKACELGVCTGYNKEKKSGNCE